MADIKVSIKRVVAIDLEAARTLLIEYSEWANRNFPTGPNALDDEDVDDFLKQFAVFEGLNDG